MNIPDYVIQLAYLVAAVCFMSGLKMLSSPRTARRGNFVSMIGMVIAVGATAASGDILNWKLILVGAAVGGIVGAVAATKIQMTAMPQMVAILNGFGGGASMLVAMAQYLKGFEGQEFVPQIAIVLAALIGGITLSGSLIAFLKLQEWMTGKPILLFGRHALNLVLLLGCVAIAIILLASGPSASLFQQLSPTAFFFILCGISLALGILLVIAIGGADMPVVISLLNSYSGMGLAVLTANEVGHFNQE